MVEASLRRLVGWISWRLLFRLDAGAMALLALMVAGRFGLEWWTDYSLASGQVHKSLLDVQITGLQDTRDMLERAGAKAGGGSANAGRVPGCASGWTRQQAPSFIKLTIASSGATDPNPKGPCMNGQEEGAAAIVEAAIGLEQAIGGITQVLAHTAKCWSSCSPWLGKSHRRSRSCESRLKRWPPGLMNVQSPCSSAILARMASISAKATASWLPGPSDLAQAIAEAKIEARTVGLTDADIDAELGTYNAERRDAPAA